MRNRRDLITLLGGAAVAWPIAAQPGLPVVGWLDSGLGQPSATSSAAFRKGLSGPVSAPNLSAAGGRRDNCAAENDFFGT
jgi:hypothetical protein